MQSYSCTSAYTLLSWPATTIEKNIKVQKIGAQTWDRPLQKVTA